MKIVNRIKGLRHLFSHYKNYKNTIYNKFQNISKKNHNNNYKNIRKDILKSGRDGRAKIKVKIAFEQN
ncbi:hypothetical protein ASD40_01745 [Paenibacillus sp. Root444D2]|nr:hypothetical protein ASD40_01745 [Paenibacillus sp. Root444D2]